MRTRATSLLGSAAQACPTRDKPSSRHESVQNKTSPFQDTRLRWPRGRKCHPLLRASAGRESAGRCPPQPASGWGAVPSARSRSRPAAALEHSQPRLRESPDERTGERELGDELAAGGVHHALREVVDREALHHCPFACGASDGHRVEDALRSTVLGAV